MRRVERIEHADEPRTVGVAHAPLRLGEKGAAISDRDADSLVVQAEPEQFEEVQHAAAQVAAQGGFSLCWRVLQRSDHEQLEQV